MGVDLVGVDLEGRHRPCSGHIHLPCTQVIVVVSDSEMAGRCELWIKLVPLTLFICFSTVKVQQKCATLLILKKLIFIDNNSNSQPKSPIKPRSKTGKGKRSKARIGRIRKQSTFKKVWFCFMIT